MADSSKKAFVFNEHENKEKSNNKDKLIELSRLVRNKCSDIQKCVLYKIDPDARSIMTVLPSQEGDYAVITMFDKTNDTKKFDLNIKLNQGVLSANKHKVLASKKFNKEYPVCKMIVKL